MKGGCIYNHGGREYWLVCTADAYFEILETYGGEFGEKLLAGGRSGLDCAIGCLCILAREGELCRRYMGYTAQDMMDADEIRHYLLPADIETMKKAILDAIQAGMRIDKNEEEKGPVDVGLAEYEKKTAITLKK